MDSEYIRQMNRDLQDCFREIRALKARLANFSTGGVILSGSVSPHGLLSSMHTDTVPGGAEEDFIVVGNASLLWEKRSLASVFLAFGSSGSSGDDPVLFDLSGLTDGATTEFGLPDFFVEDSPRVYVNGLLQRPFFDYDEGADRNSVVMVSAPESNDELVVIYMAEEAP